MDPYSDAYNAPPTAPAAADRDSAAPRGRSRSRSVGARSNGEKSGYKSPSFRRRSPAPRRPPHAPVVSFNGILLSVLRFMLRVLAGASSLKRAGGVRSEHPHRRTRLGR